MSEEIKAELHDAVSKLDQSRFNLFDWWYQYNRAKLALRDLALDVISSESRDAHPERRSQEFKQVSQDMTPDMWTVKDPTRGWIKCPRCNLMSPDINNCINCFAIDAGFQPNLEWFKSIEEKENE